MIKTAKPGRANRIADQIQRDVAELIQKEVSNPKAGLVTLTGCESLRITPMRRFISHRSGSTPEEATEALNSAAPMLHSRIFKLLKIHTVPQLHFVYDKSVERGFEMDKLIKEARAEDSEKIKGE